MMPATEADLLSPVTPGSDTTDEDGILLRVRGLETHFGQRGGLLGGGGGVVKAVDHVTFDLRKGDIFGLVGESGSGKTTLGRTILGLERATGGHVWWRGTDLTTLGERAFRPLRRKMGMVFQDPNASLNPAMTIAQGVGHPLRIHGITSDRREIRQRVAEMLERCGLTPAERYLDTYPEDVSGGQKQRVVIARTLITRPELVVADEPVAALDMSVRAKVLELMLDLKDQLGLTYLYITHDLTSARFVCDQMGIMYLGELVEWGDAAAIYDAPQHPYTDALLGAVPLPDPSRKGRQKNLPVGEIPDALDPPSGCTFHPRCPRAFEVCGWEGGDLVDYLERRWTEVDAATFERELGATGPLSDVVVDGRRARFRGGERRELLPLLADLQREGAPITTGIEDVATEGGDVVVTFREGPAPALQPVAGRLVACHLHGVVTGEPTAEAT